MQDANQPIIFVVPGDLHLTSAGLDNHRTALWMVEEVNDLVHPDFVLFIGDNVQHARPAEFQLFREVCERLRVPFFALVGDHDVQNDPDAGSFQRFIRDTYGEWSIRGTCFLRLNSVEHRPLGISNEQVKWFRRTVDSALDRRNRVVVFQHHYPFKVWEEFSGPGTEAWREIVQTRPITALFCGHTHYGQVANDGHNIFITTRSIGDPEGGPPGYTLAFLHGDDLAISYRTVKDAGPIVLITHPREKILATGREHIVSGPDEVRVRTWSAKPLANVSARVDDEDWFDLKRTDPDSWRHDLYGEALDKGEHRLEVRAEDGNGQQVVQKIAFMVDQTKRYSPVPSVHPRVLGTAFC